MNSTITLGFAFCFGLKLLSTSVNQAWLGVIRAETLAYYERASVMIPLTLTTGHQDPL